MIIFTAAERMAPAVLALGTILLAAFLEAVSSQTLADLLMGNINGFGLPGQVGLSPLLPLNLYLLDAIAARQLENQIVFGILPPSRIPRRKRRKKVKDRSCDDSAEEEDTIETESRTSLPEDQFDLADEADRNEGPTIFSDAEARNSGLDEVRGESPYNDHLRPSFLTNSEQPATADPRHSIITSSKADSRLDFRLKAAKYEKQYVKVRELECIKLHGPGWVPVGQQCYRIHSGDVCSSGRWLVKNRISRLYECQKIPCGGNKLMVALKNGTCIGSQESLLNSICWPGEEPLLTIYGFVDCGCRENFVFWEPERKCHQLYTRGPCEQGKVLGALPGNSDISCIANPCLSDDGVALDRERGDFCYKLGTRGPCHRGHIFSLDTKTHLPVCSPLDVLGGAIKGRFFCRHGSRRQHMGICLDDAKSVGGSCEDPIPKQQYDPETKCDVALLTGKFCKSGSWLILKPETFENPECVPIPCGPDEVLTEAGICVKAENFNISCAERGMKAIMTMRGVAICECPELFGFWPEDGLCYEVYTRGPCGDEEILVPGHFPELGTSALLSTSSDSPALKCSPNPCNRPKFVQWTDGVCYELGTPVPCDNGPIEELQVDEFTLHVSCLETVREAPVGHSVFDMLMRTCRPGAMLDFGGECVKGFSFMR